MIANSSNCLISPGWLASIAEGDSIINATLLTVVCLPFIYASIFTDTETFPSAAQLTAYSLDLVFSPLLQDIIFWYILLAHKHFVVIKHELHEQSLIHIKKI